MSGGLPDAQVVSCAPQFSDDELPGFEKTTLEFKAQTDGQLVATLVRRAQSENAGRPAVLYVHGFVDYFFQTHLADAFEAAGLRFYALDLRRYGRSLRPKNRPGFAYDVDDYGEELDLALALIRGLHGRVNALVAHSTGGLISSIYLATSDNQKKVQSLILCSPFLRFNLSRQDRIQAFLVASAARLFPHATLPQRLPRTYGMTIHKSEQGEWSYDLEKKPLCGFALYAGWFRMILAAHKRVEGGLGITLPILSLHPEKSRRAGKDPSEEDFCADLVLNVDDIKRLSLKLGNNVTLFAVKDGIHDLTLSKEPARSVAIDKMVQFALAHG